MQEVLATDGDEYFGLFKKQYYSCLPHYIKSMTSQRLSRSPPKNCWILITLIFEVTIFQQFIMCVASHKESDAHAYGVLLTCLITWAALLQINFISDD